jgi:hypothetical protein
MSEAEMSDKDKREGWLRDIKVGDDVIVSSWRSLSTGKVAKVTPTGKIDVDGTRYSHYGRSQEKWSSSRLVQKTGENVRELNRQRAVRYIRSNEDLLAAATWKELKPIVEAIKAIKTIKERA